MPPHRAKCNPEHGFSYAISAWLIHSLGGVAGELPEA
jgi:hypothetical protein